MIGDKRCGNCKWFFKQVKNNCECHYYPPRTTPMLLGVNKMPDGSMVPVIHLNVSRDITHEAMEACGMHAQRIALQ